MGIKPVDFWTVRQLAPAERVTRLEAMRREAQGVISAGAFANPWEAKLAENNLEKIDAELVRATQNAEASADFERQAQAKRAANEAAAEVKRQAAAEDEKQFAWSRYHSANPSATEAEFESAWPTIRERERAERTEQAIAGARASYRI